MWDIPPQLRTPPKCGTPPAMWDPPQRGTSPKLRTLEPCQAALAPWGDGDRGGPILLPPTPGQGLAPHPAPGLARTLPHGTPPHHPCGAICTLQAAPCVPQALGDTPTHLVPPRRVPQHCQPGPPPRHVPCPGGRTPPPQHVPPPWGHPTRAESLGGGIGGTQVPAACPSVPPPSHRVPSPRSPGVTACAGGVRQHEGVRLRQGVRLWRGGRCAVGIQLRWGVQLHRRIRCAVGVRRCWGGLTVPGGPAARGHPAELVESGCAGVRLCRGPAVPVVGVRVGAGGGCRRWWWVPETPGSAGGGPD